MDVRKISRVSAREESRSVLNAAINRFVESANTGKPAQTQSQQKPDFILATKFDGAKPGYYFSTASKGVGYYLDPKAPLTDASQSKEDSKGDVVEFKEKKQGVDPEILLKQAEEQAKSFETLDSKAVRRLVLAFERKYKDNLEQRMKYSDQPERFMDSEVDLDQCVQDFLQLVNNPDLYPALVEANAIPHLLNLLTHENVDIAMDVVDLFQALTDTEDNEEWAAEFKVLVSTMLENNALELLIQRLGQLNETGEEEAGAIFNILTIIENMIDVSPEVSRLVVERKLLRWMLLRLRPREFDSIKQYVAELLAVLMQGGEYNLRMMGEMGGIDSILEGIAQFKSRDPQTDDESEFLSNQFDALCSCLLLPENRAKFVESEGMELMLLILKQKTVARYGSIKVLEFATTQCPLACDRFVDVLGLKTLFSLFMARSRLSEKKDREKDQQAEEMLVTIIANLFQEIMKGSRRDRVAAKFVENEFEKCDRLMEIYFSYNARLGAEEARLAEMEDDLLQEDEIMVARLNSGLSVLQQVCLIVAHLWSIGDLALNQRLLMLLHQKGHTLSQPRAILAEMIDMIGGEGLEREQQQKRLHQLLLGLGGREIDAKNEDLEPEPLDPPSATGNTETSAAGVKRKDSGRKENEANQSSASANQQPASRDAKGEVERSRERRGKRGGAGGSTEKDKEQKEREREKRRDREHRRERYSEKDAHHHRDKRRREREDGKKR
ncbi:hypothetical protein BSKO_12950 [Bryopsis sp. KO-2023]|nr:hypothetical protein BSKO_12950 [Bryopsis sp. KO-2023]